jgi:translin
VRWATAIWNCAAPPTDLIPTSDELGRLVGEARSQLDQVSQAREAGLSACRAAIRAAGQSIRAVHRLADEDAAAFVAQSEEAIRRAQAALHPFPVVAHAGFLHDAEKEYAEAVLTRALVSGDRLPSPAEVGVGVPAWLNGLAEAASELRRHLLDRLRRDETDRAEALLTAMDDVYESLLGVDLPDAVTGGLRRTTDALRAVLERTRSDVSATLMQVRLRQALESAAGRSALA